MYTPCQAKLLFSCERQQLTEKIQRIDNNIFLGYGLPVALAPLSLIVTEE